MLAACTNETSAESGTAAREVQVTTCLTLRGSQVRPVKSILLRSLHWCSPHRRVMCVQVTDLQRTLHCHDP